MRKVNRYQLFAISVFSAFSAQAQNYSANSVSQPIPVAPPYTAYPTQSIAAPQPIATQPTQIAVAPQEVVVPPGVVYVAPPYPAPAVGFVWAYHPRFGWGWRHSVHGWHRGWR